MRIPRGISVQAGYAVHKMWRGHNREWNLETDEEKRKYLEFLNEDLESEKYESGAELNALTLMSNHSHEMVRVSNVVQFSGHMRRHHSRYGAFFNKLHNRCGKVAQDRPKTCLITSDYHEMLATFYIHSNPIRARLVGDAKDYPWSTHRLFAYGTRDWWMVNVKFPNWYKSLGRTMEERQRNYRKAFDAYLKHSGLRKQNFLRNLVYGQEWVKQSIEKEIKAWRQGKSPPS